MNRWAPAPISILRSVFKSLPNFSGINKTGGIYRPNTMVIPGIEMLIKDASLLDGKRVGLIANGASVGHDMTSSVDLLYNHPDVNLTTLFGPQQGFWGETQDNMVEWESGRYPKYGLPLYSLYGKQRKPTPEMLKDVDTLIFDVQDAGCRVYTYIWTMALSIAACAEMDKKFIVVDRPNPISGIDVEGNVSTTDFASFVALYPIPLRHGMTAGEIAAYINEEYKIGCDLTVIKMKGWKRRMWFDETGLPWVMPSANLPTLDTAIVYTGTVIFEGTNISEGRGTTRPFEFIGAPFIDGFRLADELARCCAEGAHFRPCVFIPTFGKFAGENCGGVQLHVTDRGRFKPVEAALTMLLTIRSLYPTDFKWREPPYEYTFDRPPIDMIFGADWIRKAVDSKLPANKIMDKFRDEIANFNVVRKKYLMY